MLRQAEEAHGSWTGAGADAALERARNEVTAGRRIASQVDKVVTALNDGATRLASARDSLPSEVDSAIADHFAVDDKHWTVTDTAGKDRENARANHQAIITARHDTLVSEDDQVSFAIDAAIDEAFATATDVSAGRDYVPPALAGLPPSQVQAVISDPRFQEWVRNHPDAAKPLLDAAFDAGKITNDSTFYQKFLAGFWQQEVMEKAGIDPAKWDPSKGTGFNKETITKVYQYYGQLFLDHPEMQWAGMANMIGPSFAGGFYDLRMLREYSAKFPYLPGSPLNVLSKLSEAEIGWYEQKFLSMQQQIFNDQGSAHVAYLHGGTAEIDRMARAGLLDGNGKDAWHEIDDGIRSHDRGLVAEGNKKLLYREQHDIIDDDYQELYNRPVTGKAVTYALTAVGAPSIPGAHAFGEVFPQVFVREDFWHRETHITHLPDGNIAKYNDRWKLIIEDTLPAYQQVLDANLNNARDIIDSDFNTRLEEQRLSHQIDDNLKRLAYHEVKVEWKDPFENFRWPWDR